MRLTKLLPLVLLLALAAVLAGAGGRDAPPAQAAAPRAIKLSVSWLRRDGAPARRATLLCTASSFSGGGYLSNRTTNLCRKAQRGYRDVRGRKPGDGSCLAAVYGEQRATITGTINGRPFKNVVSRVDSCADDEYQAVEFLFPYPHTRPRLDP